MFTVIAERINMSRKEIGKQVRARNAGFIAGEARRQTEAGATHIDINAGGNPGTEMEDMRWLVETVAKATELPICFDSPNAEVLKAGLELCNREGTIINSITLESERVKGVLPLVKEFGTGVVSLTMDDGGMPEDLAGRVRVIDGLVEMFGKSGVGLERVYFDPLVRPASTNPGQARDLLEAIRYLRTKHPETHVALGLSNISFGLPKRKLLNRTFLAMLISAGADGAVLDPLDREMMTTLLAGRAVLGLDEYALEYIMAEREGKLSAEAGSKK